jgi:hypothetical protein
MAVRKKAKAKVKPKKAPAGKPATRKKTAPVKKKLARKKPAARATAPKKKPAVRPVPKAPQAGKPSQPAEAPAPAAAPAPAPATPAIPLTGEERVGTVTHYYGDISVAVVKMESGSLRLGDTIHVRGHSSDFRQRVKSMQIEHKPVSEVGAGQEFALAVTGHPREHDIVYKVTSPLQ